MTRAVHRAGFRPLVIASRQLLLRPAALNIAAIMMLMLLALGLYSLSRGSFPLPASTLARALLAPQDMGEQPRFILFDIRLPRILMALLCGAMLGMAGAAMQSITRNGLADPGLIGVKEGASIVVLALVLFFPAVGLVWRPLAGMVGGVAVALLVLTLARDCSRPRFILIGIGVSWTLAAAVGIFMTTADVRDVQTAMIWLAGSLQAATWPLLAVAFCWALPGAIILFFTARAADVALLGDRTAIGLGVRLQQLTMLRFFAPVLLTSASVSCVGSLGFVGLMAPHMARFVLRGGQVSLLCGSALIGVKEGANIVVLALVLFFPAVGLVWRPLAGMVGGVAVALLVLTLARDCSRPRFILIGIGVSWTLAAAVGIFMTTADVRDVQTAMIWLAGSLQAASWPLLAVAFCWALPGAIILFCTARAADVALLGDRTAIGLGVRLQQLTVLRFFAPVLLTSASVSCVGSLGFVGLMAPHMARFVLRGGQVSLLCGSALIGALLVLATDTLGRLAFAPLQIPAGIVIALVGCPFFVILLWRRRDAL